MSAPESIVATPSPTAATILRRTGTPSKSDLLDHYREALRLEVREQELSALVAELTELRAQLADAQANHMALYRSMLAELQRIQAPAPASSAALEALASQGVGGVHSEKDTDIPEGFELVSDAFLDFIEAADMINTAIVKRRPLELQLRIVYTELGRREIHILRRGVYGTSDYMRNVRLTLMVDEPDYGPYVKGEYMDDQRLMSMTPEQVGRVCEAVLQATREQWDLMVEAATQR